MSPMRIWLRVRVHTVTGERARSWLDDLLALPDAGKQALGD
jgi:hypothetical protein